MIKQNKEEQIMKYKGYFIEYLVNTQFFRVTRIGNPFESVATLNADPEFKEDGLYESFDDVKKYIDNELINQH